MLCPVCFVFKPRTVARVVHRVYPCDTGTVAADRFHPEILASDLAQLALEPGFFLLWRTSVTRGAR